MLVLKICKNDIANKFTRFYNVGRCIVVITTVVKKIYMC